ncbi:MAG: 4'-phosphopantetheinyl transferase superfamily protein [Bacteroidia bacterium]
MPFLRLESHMPDVSLGVWKIEEDELYFLERVKLYEHEWVRLGEIMHPQKRLEWLSSRLCLKDLISIANHTRVESLSTASGKPYLSSNSHFISYSHSNHYSAAIASPHQEVGIDIEYRHHERNLRTRFLFMNDDELAAYDRLPSFELFLLIWSAKETLYKIVGQGFAFKHHIGLIMIDFALATNGMLPACVQKDGFIQHYEVHYYLTADYILTYAGAGL